MNASWPIDGLEPYPQLAALAAEGPIHRLEDLDAWLVVSHELAREVLRGGCWSADPLASAAGRARLGALSEEMVRRTALFTDGADHLRLRHALRSLLTPAAVAANRHRIEAVVEEAVAAFVAEPGDFMAEVAYAIPLAVICELLDAGDDIAVSLRRDTPTMTALLDPLADADQLEAATAAGVGLSVELMALVAERSARPGPDMLSQVITRLETEEALAMALLVLVAGHETTASLIGNAFSLLVGQPALADTLTDDPDRAGDFVEELLRHEPPVQLTARVAGEDRRLGGARIRAGDRVFVSLAGANRDPAVYREPDRFDPRRRERPHLSFGYGSHACAGAALARAEAEAAVRRLAGPARLFSDSGMELTRIPSATFRRIGRLSVPLPAGPG